MKLERHHRIIDPLHTLRLAPSRGGARRFRPALWALCALVAACDPASSKEESTGTSQGSGGTGGDTDGSATDGSTGGNDGSSTGGGNGDFDMCPMPVGDLSAPIEGMFDVREMGGGSIVDLGSFDTPMRVSCVLTTNDHQAGRTDLAADCVLQEGDPATAVTITIEHDGHEALPLAPGDAFDLAWSYEFPDFDEPRLVAAIYDQVQGTERLLWAGAKSSGDWPSVTGPLTLDGSPWTSEPCAHETLDPGGDICEVDYFPIAFSLDGTSVTLSQGNSGDIGDPATHRAFLFRAHEVAYCPPGGGDAATTAFDWAVQILP